MIFKRLFFKPPISKLLLGRKKRRPLSPQDQEGLIRSVRTDPDAGVRCDACRLINRLPELRELASSDLEADMREVAVSRYLTLLCQQQEGGPDLAERLQEIDALDDQRILEQVALGGQEAELRRAAIAKIASQDLVATCALNDPLAANRGAAIDLLDGKDALERVVKNIGRKDKLVYRAARRKLKEIAEREALPERVRTQCEELCEKLERLGRFGQWVQDRAMLDLLDRQWEQIEPQADLAHKACYRRLRDRFLCAYQEYRSEHEAQVAEEENREAIRAERRVLLEDLQALSALIEEVQVARGLERIAARWDALALLPDQEQAALERRYADAREVAAGHLGELAATARGRSQLGELLARGEQILAQAKPLDRKLVRGLLDQAEPLLKAKGIERSAAARFNEVREALDERLRQQKAQAEARLARLPEKLDEFSKAIEKGVLKEAEPLYQSIVSGVELIESSGLPRKDYAEAVTRLRALAPRLRDLQKWRKWGTDQRRLELCISMEELGSEELRLEAMTLRLQELRKEWKGLDKSGSPANQPLWERFQAASECVYQRCRPYLEEQAAEREANREQRERLCRELEAFLDQADWERMDWKKAAQAEREMRQAWASMGAVDGRHRKALEKRFRAASKRLSGCLAQERSHNQAHKRELIARIEALAEEPDLGRAIEETKRLQRQWHTTVAARQKEENRLWQRFRDASDVVFARRREQQEAQANELGENLRRREGMCAEMERLAISNAGADELAAALADLDKRWRDSEALSVPRQSVVVLSRRWRTACALVEDRRRERLEDQHRKTLNLLAEQAALCERLERALETGAEADPALSSIETDWRSLPIHRDPDLQAAIEERFGSARKALQQGGEKLQALRSAFAVAGERRAELCLHLEILARIDSPPEHTAERLRFQVTRLTEHMREGEGDPLEATSRLLQQWYLCGPAPAPEAGVLEQRFQRARRAIEAVERESGTIRERRPPAVVEGNLRSQ